MNKIFIATLLLLLAIPAMAEEAHLIRVVDADSLMVEIHGLPVAVRLNGIDAPEWKQEWGEQATEFVREWTGHGVLKLEFDRNKVDRYNRLLAWVWCDGHMLNEDLVASGLALPYLISEKGKHYKRIAAALEQAKANKAGFWGKGGLKMTPHEWRKKARTK